MILPRMLMQSVGRSQVLRKARHLKFRIIETQIVAVPRRLAKAA
jgi:hypothetical protein